MNRTMIVAASLIFILCLACAEKPPEDPWARGVANELVVGRRIEVTSEFLEGWKEAGVNAVLRADPALGDEVGLLTRTSTNIMTLRKSDKDTFGDVATVGPDGEPLNWYDALWPGTANNMWGCYNKPDWYAHKLGQLKDMAEAGHDGVHIDFTNFTQDCFCPMCQAEWGEYRDLIGLPGVGLREAYESQDLRVHLFYKEFRIRDIVQFMKKLKTDMEAVKPNFGIDGTWHVDPISVYTWCYARGAYDLICGESVCYSPRYLHPEGEHVLFYKLAHGISDNRPGTGTSYLLGHKGGWTWPLVYDRLYYIRDYSRVRVESYNAEVLATGDVTWFAFNGEIEPYQDIVLGLYRFKKDNAKYFKYDRPYTRVAWLFSPKSYLLNAESRRGAYDSGGLDMFQVREEGEVRQSFFGLGHALMREHYPFDIVAEFDIHNDPSILDKYGVVLINQMQATSPEVVEAVGEFMMNGGTAIFIGRFADYTWTWKPMNNRNIQGIWESSEEIIEGEIEDGNFAWSKKDLFTYRPTPFNEKKGKYHEEGRFNKLSNPKAYEKATDLLDSWMPSGRLVALSGEGEKFVFVEPYLVKKDVVLHLLNYNAETNVLLSPEEMVAKEHVIPVNNLQISVKVPEGTSIKSAKFLQPFGEDIDLEVEIEDGRATVTVPELGVYGVVVLSG